MEEKWKQVFFGLGAYEISSHGRVRRAVPANRYKAGHILKPSKNKWGHLSVFLCCSVTGRRKHFFIHRLVAFAFIQNKNLKFKMVLHIDGNPENNMVENLKWGDNSENRKDSIRHGTIFKPKGEKNPSCKLTVSQVRNIKKLLKDGKTCEEISKKYPVHRVTISRIKRKINWRNF